MFGRAIWDKLPECIFENFEIARVKGRQLSILNLHKHRNFYRTISQAKKKLIQKAAIKYYGKQQQAYII